MKAESVFTGGNDLSFDEALGGAIGKVVQIYQSSHETAGGLEVRRHGQPIVQGTDLVYFKMAPTNPSEGGGIDQAGNRFEQFGKHAAHARVVEQGFVISDEEVIELKVERFDVDADTKKIGGDFVDSGHDEGD